MTEQKSPAPEISSGKEIHPAELPEVEELKKRIEKLESQLKKERVISEEKEKVFKEEIKSHIREVQQTPVFAPPTATRDEADEISKFEPSQQVGALLNLVFEKGLPQALSVAKALNNPAILDEFHDILVDRYYEMLIEKKIVRH